MFYVTRFAPSPTGPLHLGHAFSALTAYRRALAQGGRFLLRIDDGDISRAREEWIDLIKEDLSWLGLSWPEPCLQASENQNAYKTALDQLTSLGLTYPCACTRRDIQNALSAPQEDVTFGPDGIVYPGTCRPRDITDLQKGEAIRLNMRAAIDHLGDVSKISWLETGPAYEGSYALDPNTLIEGVGDIVLYRKEIGTAAYHLSVVVDDAADGISEAVRGEDLFEATQIHVLLAALLGVSGPNYHHHRLIRDENGKRYAKRSDAKAIRKFREDGATPEDIMAMIGLDPA